MPRRWLAGLRFETQCMASCLTTACGCRGGDGAAPTVSKPTSQRRCRTRRSPWWCMRCRRCGGMALVAAATLVAELGDVTRFAVHASSWRILAWCRPSTAVAARDAKADHKGWRQCGWEDADRSRLELSVPGADQPRAGAAAGRSGQADPRCRVEGKDDFVGGIASWRGRANHRPWSPPRSRASCRLCRRSPDWRSPSAPDISLDANQGGRIGPTHVESWQGWRRHGRRPSFPLPAGSRPTWLLNRGSSATHHGPAVTNHASSMIDRRFMIVPPALPMAAALNSLEDKQDIRPSSLKWRT